MGGTCKVGPQPLPAGPMRGQACVAVERHGSG